ncbi:helix-turn-helix transcriptional regulator [Christensenellaceae bacterium OttesenSCG-928-K19]|nr:helix-turn-helix transcriptional regulator [Christensenellaceae bacterium OttesenSCG-928-K19]
MQYDHKVIGERIRKKRESLGWSQEYLGECSNYSVQHIGNIERGQAKASVEAFLRIAKALKTSLDSILCYDENKVESYIIYEINQMLERADENQLKVIAGTLNAMITSWNDIKNESLRRSR